MRSTNFEREVLTTLLGFLALLFLLVSFTSCGKNNNTGTREPVRNRYYANYRVSTYVNTRCQVVGYQPCGYTLNCGRYGMYFCAQGIILK